MIPQLLLGALISWVLYSAKSLYYNIRRARTLHVPLIIIPVSPMNVLWIICEPLIFSVLDILPFKSESFNHYARRGWHFKDKSSSHVKYGDAFAIVTPRETFLSIGEPNAINDIFARRQDFVRPVELYKMLDVFGSNVSTVGWEDWKRQRKIVAAPFNENTNKLVWTESLSQTRDMIEAWTQYGDSGIIGVAKDTRTLSLDVLAATGFRKSHKFRSSMEPGTDEAKTYRQALAITMDNSLLMMLVPPSFLNLPFLPKALKKVGSATYALKQYMMDMLNEEQRLLDSGKPGTGNLMTGLVRASETAQSKRSEKGDSDSEGKKGLSVSEILGNIFVINFAGHDTTANTLSFALLLLAAYPEVQDWVSEEIREVFGDSNSETWNYELSFPRLKRCFAVLLETLRLYPPIMALPKYTSKNSTTLTVGERLMTIPPDTMVVPSLLAMHTHPKYWPNEPLKYNPFRWISLPPNMTSSNTTLSTRLEDERLFEPEKGTYFPWSDGPQYCPGKKFAQVEFLAVLAGLFQSHRVSLAGTGMSQEEKKKTILACCEDSEQTLLLRMRRADDLRLVWDKVGA